MTSVGTPIYVAPEVMAGNRYDATADSYSFGICLVAMVRADKDLLEFYFQALRKTMKRKTKNGVGITILNHRMYRKGWRPLLPLEFKRSYPKLCILLKKCWAQNPEDRPSFDEIVKTMQGEVAEEVLRKDEPSITVYSVEDDAIYHERMGKEEHFEDDWEEGMDTAKMVRQRVHTETLEKKDDSRVPGDNGEEGANPRGNTGDAGEEEGCCHRKEGSCHQGAAGACEVI